MSEERERELPAARPIAGAPGNGRADAADPRLIDVRSESDVPEAYRGTPIWHLLAAQNLGSVFPVGPTPSLLIATCIDSRVRLELPPGAAFELRDAGVNLNMHSFFQIAFAVSVVGVKHIAVVGHDDCAMTTLASSESAFVEGMAESSQWDAWEAKSFFREHVDDWHVEDPVVTVIGHAQGLRSRFPSVTFAPLLYSVRDQKIRAIDERG
jgi:carbonic anhydrase